MLSEGIGEVGNKVFSHAPISSPLSVLYRTVNKNEISRVAIYKYGKKTYPLSWILATTSSPLWTPSLTLFQIQHDNFNQRRRRSSAGDASQFPLLSLTLSIPYLRHASGWISLARVEEEGLGLERVSSFAIAILTHRPKKVSFQGGVCFLYYHYSSHLTSWLDLATTEIDLVSLDPMTGGIDSMLACLI